MSGRDRRQRELEALASALMEERGLPLKLALIEAQKLMPALTLLLNQYNLEEAAQRATKGQPQ